MSAYEFRNRVQEVLDKEASLSEAAQALLTAIAPLDIGPTTRSTIAEGIRLAPSNSGAFSAAERTLLVSLLQKWDEATPFQHFLIFIALQHFMLARLWNRISPEESSWEWTAE